jgi:hypothetical protein
MSNSTDRSEVREQTRLLLNGPLKHIRAAALAAALLPLASVAATPASAQTICPSGGVCGFVFNDANNDGFQDAGETGIEGAKVSLFDGTDTILTETGPDGTFTFAGLPDGTYTIAVQVPQGTQPSPSNVGSDDFDSDGVPDNLGSSVATVTRVDGSADSTDFGFFTKPVAQPGTGTPGYWKNHPDAWPVSSITVGGLTYTKAQAIAWLGKVGKDKTTTMFSSLVPAMLNVIAGNDGSCVNSTIIAANAWMATYGPVGANVSASSYAWSVGEPLHIQMDNYNNGLLCAPHRN